MPLLEIKNLTVAFDTSVGLFHAVRGIDLAVDAREVLAIVGESGSGKSVAMLSVMGLLPKSATVTADRMSFEGQDLLPLSPHDRRKIIGKDIAMISQEPMSSLNPCFTVGFQLTEALKPHLDLDKRARRARAARVAHAMCGVMTQLRAVSSGLSTDGGSCDSTSSPAPAISPAASPRVIAFSSITSPREVLIITAEGFSSLSLRAFSKWNVEGVCGQLIDKISIRAII